MFPSSTMTTAHQGSVPGSRGYRERPARKRLQEDRFNHLEGESTELLNAFSRYFEVIRADTDALREQVFRLRYRVYCVETGFESAAGFPDGLERDAYDLGSCHSLLRHKATGWWAGTVRLVLPDTTGADGKFPVERACGSVFSSDRLDSPKLPRDRTAEVSRFAVSKEFRRRYKEYLSPTGISDDSPLDGFVFQPNADGRVPRSAVVAGCRQRDEERRVIPHITLGLFQAMVEMSADCRISHWAVAMEQGLLRLFDRIGIHFHPVGELVEYHGKRQPCVAEVSELLEAAKCERPDVWAVLTRGGSITTHQS